MAMPHKVVALIAAIALSALSLIGVRLGCETGLMRQPSPPDTATATALADASNDGVALPTTTRLVRSTDQGGVGLDTGMPYYSFAQRSLRL